jgi:uracil-DNA glycosylase family 4
MASRTRVLSRANGNPCSKVLFVAEAPGRLGADKSGIPLSGDASGRLFEELLGCAGWSRDDVFITNALLCNPRTENGNNDKPTGVELENCSAYLAATLSLVDPQVVVALGAVALAALDRIQAHGLTLQANVGTPHEWNNRHLIPLYHPGPRARVHRSAIHQRADYADLAAFVDPKRGLRLLSTRRRTTRNPGAALDQLMVAIVSLLGRTSYYRLTKLLYLTDLAAADQRGRPITGQVYVRAAEGPWPPSLPDALARLRGHELACYGRGRALEVRPGPDRRFDIELDDEALRILADVAGRYAWRSERELKISAYLTTPMREMIKREKRGERTRGTPLPLLARPE